MRSQWDLLIRGGTVVDGTGLPGYTADVGVRDGRIAGIGRLTGDADREIDADGLTVTPGFIDIHTHYDAQLAWEPTASPSCWNGVTSVVCGNCGFTLAPARPGDVGWLAQMLSRVEGMSAEALGVALEWEGGSFGAFWDRLEGRLGVNAGGYVGHSAVRRHVMGDDASERTATADEIAAMQQVVRDAMTQGALGFSSSQLDIHVAHDGREVPSNHAAPEEIVALAGVLAEFGRGSIEFIPRSYAQGYDEADRRLLLDLYAASGRPVELNTLHRLPLNPESWKVSLDFAREAQEAGARIRPMFSTNLNGAHFALASTFMFDEFPVWRETLTLPPDEREARLRDPDHRQRLKDDLDDLDGKSFMFYWPVVELERPGAAAHEALVGASVTAIAEQRGVDEVDAFLDLSLEGGLETGFVMAAPHDPAADEATRTLIQEPSVSAGSSDAGAHLLSFVGADFTTRLLSEWVPHALGFEDAVRRLTLVPATVHGIADRGLVREGAWADLNLIDRSRLRAGQVDLRRDFPAGSARYVIDADGYVATVVNGTVLLEQGKHTGALPGHVLRGGDARNQPYRAR